MLRSLYDKILSWCESKYSIYVLATVSFFEASVFPVPPDPLLITICLSRPKKSLQVALVCSVFSVLGAVLGYFIGLALWSAVDGFFFDHIFSEQLFLTVKQLYHENSFAALLTAAFTPIPYKVFTIAAGVFQISFVDLIVASAIGRSARFFLEGGLIYFFGAEIKTFIDRYFNLLTILVTLLIIALAVLYKLLGQ